MKRQRRVIQVYGLARDEGVHNVFLPTRLPEVCKILVRRRVEGVQGATQPRIGMQGAKPRSGGDVPLPFPVWIGRKQAFR